MSVKAVISQKVFELLKQQADQGIASSDIALFLCCSNNDPEEIKKAIHSFRGAIFTLRSQQKRIDFIDGKYYYKGDGEYSLFRHKPGETERKLFSKREKIKKGKKPVTSKNSDTTETLVPVVPLQGNSSSGAFVFATNRKAFDKLKKILSPAAQEELENIAISLEQYNKLSNNLAELRPFLKAVNMELLLSGK